MSHATEMRVVQQAYKFELDPNQVQRVLLVKSVGASRYVYNWGLAESQRQYELSGKRLRLGELKAQLVHLKKGECLWLYEVSAHIGQQALHDLDRAFRRFFEGLSRKGPKSGFPRFKRKSERDSARLYEVTLSDRHVEFPKIGRVRLKETLSERGFQGRFLSATIRRRADHWFVSIAVEQEREVALPKPIDPTKRPTPIVGVDLGLTNAAVIHDGSTTQVIEPQRALRSNLAKLRRLDRQLARKQKGSNNRHKAKLRRARLHYKISCQRGDFLHQFSSSLARTKRTFDCTACGLSLDRDENAAINLRSHGLKALERKQLGIVPLPGSLREVTPVGEEGSARSSIATKPASLKQEATANGTRRSTRRSTPKDVLVRV